MTTHKTAIITALLTFLAWAAPARAGVNFDVYIDNPEYVSAKVNWNQVDIVRGLNRFSLDDYDNFGIEPRESSKHWLKAIYLDGTNQLTGTNQYFSRNQYNLSELNGKTIIVESATKEELRTGTIKIKPDNVSRISNVSLAGSYTTLSYKNWTAGEFNTVNYTPGLDTEIQINFNGAPGYKVLADGEEVPVGRYGVSVPLHEGLELELFGDWPAENATITFNWLNDGRSYLKEVYVYGSAEENYVHKPVEFSSGTAKVPLGSQVVLGHTEAYKDFVVNSYTVDGEPSSYASETRQFYVVSDIDVVMDISLSEAIGVTIDVDNPEAVLVKKYAYGDETIPLVAGENNVTMHATNSDITVKRMPGYTIESCAADGEPIEPNWSGDFGTVAREGRKIVIRTAKKPTYKCRLTVADASCITAKTNYNTSFPVREIELKDGRNEIELSEDSRDIHIFAVDGCWIDGVNLNGDNLEPEYDGHYRIQMDEDYEAVVDARTIVRDRRYVLWFDTLSLPNLGSREWRYSNGRQTDTDIAAGYNLKHFFHGDNYFKMSAYYDYGTVVTYAVYLNGEPAAPEYPGTTGTVLNLEDGDVVKVFLGNANPSTYSVDFTVTGADDPKVGGSVNFGEVLRDIIVPVTDLSAPETVLEGTRYDFTIDNAATEEVTIAISANGTVLEPDAEGVYSLTVNADTHVELAYAMVPYAELFLTGDFNDWAHTDAMTTDDGKTYTAELPSLPGQFKIFDASRSIELGANSSLVPLGEPYAAVQGTPANMILADPEATDIKVSLDLPSATITVSGTSGIAGIFSDCHAAEAYYTLQGVRLPGRPTAAGAYILVTPTAGRKVLVK